MFHLQIFWTVSGKFQAKIKVGEHQIKKRNELIFSSILGGRLVGMGWQSLKLYHAALGIPQPCSSEIFNEALGSVALVAEELARCSMENARDTLKEFLKVDPCTSQFRALASYDGSYQQRGGKAGGGHSRYCFAAAISTDTNQVLSYGIACNSCPLCTEYGNKLCDGRISPSKHDSWFQNHKLTCPAKFAHLFFAQQSESLESIMYKSKEKVGILGLK